MLGVASLLSRPFKALLPWIFPLFVLGLSLAAFTWNSESVFLGGSVYFTDGDCYARMTRVRMLQEHPFEPVRQHAFENYPTGTQPHTTAPLDYLILGLSILLRPFSSDSLSLAGAWVSPLIGLATCGFLAFRVRGVRFGYATILLLAISPVISHGFLLGRPDHQSLLMLLIAIALMAELDIWTEKMGGVLSAVAWSLALWVSLFEPLILLILILVLRIFSRRLVIDRKSVVIFLGFLLAGFLVDGFRAAAFDDHFAKWSQNIGELRHGTLAVISGWAGWLGPIAPFILLAAYLRKKDPALLLLGVLLLATGALTLWHLRWGYFFALVFAISLPWILGLTRWRIAGWGLFIISLWPVAAEWEKTLYPDEAGFRARAESVVDAAALRDAAIQLKGLPERGVLAPWWFSPAIVWWSGQPCVGGTSHQSLPGIVDASEFYLSDGDGREILEQRKAGYIFAYEPERVISNASQILGRPASTNPLARRIYDHPRASGYPLIYANRFFKVFEKPESQK